MTARRPPGFARPIASSTYSTLTPDVVECLKNRGARRPGIIERNHGYRNLQVGREVARHVTSTACAEGARSGRIQHGDSAM